MKSMKRIVVGVLLACALATTPARAQAAPLPDPNASLAGSSCTQSGLSLYRFWFANPSSSAATFDVLIVHDKIRRTFQLSLGPGQGMAWDFLFVIQGNDRVAVRWRHKPLLHVKMTNVCPSA